MGNDKKVYIINGVGYSMDKVKDDLHNERYPYNFHYDKNPQALIDADEVWLFGDCKNESDLINAVSLGKSVWIMG